MTTAVKNRPGVVAGAESAAALRDARDALRAGDARRASGKAWEAVARNLRAVSDERGWQRAESGMHEEAGDLIKIGGFLAEETDNPREFHTHMASASMLYVHSQEDHY